MVAQAGVRLSTPWIEDGVVWWLEGRAAEAGRVVLVAPRPATAAYDVVPADFNVRTSVHEYGGGAYCVHDGVAFVSNFDDQRLYRVDPASDPTPITPDVEGRRHRYADGRITPDGALWIGVRERHAESDRSEGRRQRARRGTDRRLVRAAGDRKRPELLLDSAHLARRQAALPSSPGISPGCRGTAASCSWPSSVRTGPSARLTHVAGADGVESIWQPEWSPSGDLVFASDRSGWWNLERVRDGERTALHPAEAEFGYPAWTFGSRSFAFLDDGRIACAYDREGFTSFGILDPDAGTLEELDLGLDALAGSPYVVAEGSHVVLAAGSALIPNQLVRIDVESGAFDVLRTSSAVAVDPEYFSTPRAVEFPTAGGQTAHALVYPPTSPGFEAPVGELPPLVVMSHGGPTGNATAIFNLETQFWTSRGFAVVDVNYGGSTGYGRAYRERLNGQWGVVDLQDCVNAARYLVEQGQADPDRLLITGGSAGGYTTICALTFTDAFAAGATYFGIADLEQFGGGETHKFELQYEHTLVGPYPEAANVYRERSPIHFADRISTPMLVLQGADDRIVPPLRPS